MCAETQDTEAKAYDTQTDNCDGKAQKERPR